MSGVRFVFVFAFFATPFAAPTPLVAQPAGKGGAAPSAAPPSARSAAAPALLERRLYSDAIEASSFLWNDWNRFQENYHPNYLADEDPTTGWVEGAPNSGAGEWVRIAVTPLQGTTRVRLRIRNGYQKSPALFRANARAREVKLKLLPSGAERTVQLADKQGWQEAVIEQPAAMLRDVELAVVSVYEGGKYRDLVISDVQVYATSSTRDNPTFEKGKRQSLLEWRKARIAAAKLFKAGRGAALPLYSSYRAQPQQLEAKVEEALRGRGPAALLAAASLDPGFAPWRAALEVGMDVLAHEDALAPAQLSPVAGDPLPEVDGFEQLELDQVFEGVLRDGALRLPLLGDSSAFFVEKLRVLDQKGASLPDYRDRAYGGRCKPARWVKRSKSREAAAPDRVIALVVAECGEVPSREGTSLALMEQLLVFDDEGRLVLLVGDGYVDGYRWDSGGKIGGGRSLQSSGAVIELRKGQVAAR
jgi:hypothetical protein